MKQHCRLALGMSWALVMAACGTTPVGTVETPSCAAASIADVVAALEGVPGYSFTASGTSLRPRPGAPGSDADQYDTYGFELRGAYQAPDRSRLEVADPRPPLPLSDPAIFFLGADAIVVVGGDSWLVGKDHVQHVDGDMGGANLLLEVIRGTPELAQLAWASPAPCRFEGRAQRDGLRATVRVEVGPGALPRTISEEFRNEPADASEPLRAYDLTYRPDYAEVPVIEAPGP